MFFHSLVFTFRHIRRYGGNVNVYSVFRTSWLVPTLHVLDIFQNQCFTGKYIFIGDSMCLYSLCFYDNSYLGSGRYKARWLTLGCVSLLLGSIVMVLPHFTTGLYSWGQSEAATCDRAGTNRSRMQLQCNRNVYQSVKRNKSSSLSLNYQTNVQFSNHILYIAFF